MCEFASIIVLPEFAHTVYIYVILIKPVMNAYAHIYAHIHTYLLQGLH